MRKKLCKTVCIAVVSCCVMALVDGVIRPGYAAKSAVKIGMFLLLPLLLCGRDLDLKSMFRLRGRGFALSLGLGLALYGCIVGGFFLLRPVVDFSGIAGALSQNAGVRGDNFLWVSLYIAFFNSLLEEFFFRGFLFLNLKRYGRGFAYGFSAGLFSLYHAAMMLGWFPWWLLAAVLLGLFAGGAVLNRLDETQGTLYTGYFVHIFANFAINTVGFILFAQ